MSRGALATGLTVAVALLGARSDGADGRFAKVAQVQRLNTEGGQAPAAGCDRTRLGQRAEVPYRADYVFFNPTL